MALDHNIEYQIHVMYVHLLALAKLLQSARNKKANITDYLQ
jgi:hypothetical protein